MQVTSSGVYEIWVTCGNWTRNHTNPNRMHLSIARRYCSKSFTESLDNSTFNRSATHSRFQQGGCSDYLVKDYSKTPTSYDGEVWP
jgi:hypothetical protein